MQGFLANSATANRCFGKYNQQGILFTIGVAIFMYLEVTASYFRFHQKGFTVFYILLS